jgi:ADP-heptose:LPS heptosyltransferase
MMLHPGLMYRLFAPFWAHDAPVEHILSHTVPKRMVPPAAALTGLPERFVAVRFPFNSTFPDTAANRAYLDALLASLTQSHEVVWLGSAIDDTGEREYTPQRDYVHDIRHLLTPEHELALHAAIIARADAYVGTYDGTSYVAAGFGVRSVAFYAVRDSFPHYRSVAEHMFGGRENLSLMVLNIADAALLRRVLATEPRAAML